MTTFSQLVDKIVFETKRPDLVNDIVSYLNQTLRELHSRPDNGATILYPENRQEIQLTADLETGFSWLTNQTRFQILETVRYDSLIDEKDDPIYPVITIPGRNMNQHIYYVYRAGAYYYFIGYGGIDAKISISYFTFVRSKAYVAAAARKVTYHEDTGFSYAPELNTQELREAEFEKNSDWMLARWATVVEEGLKAKTYKRISDEVRMRTSYSLYSQLREGMYMAETGSTQGFSSR